MEKVDGVLEKNEFVVRTDSAQISTRGLTNELGITDDKAFLKICEGGHWYFHSEEYKACPLPLYWYSMKGNTQLEGLDQSTFAKGVIDGEIRADKQRSWSSLKKNSN